MGKSVNHGAFTLMVSYAQSMIGKRVARLLAELHDGMLAAQADSHTVLSVWLSWNTAFVSMAMKQGVILTTIVLEGS